jgi:hypothetical protein
MGLGCESPSDTERMFDSATEVSMNLGCFRVKDAVREWFRDGIREWLRESRQGSDSWPDVDSHGQLRSIV